MVLRVWFLCGVLFCFPLYAFCEAPVLSWTTQYEQARLTAEATGTPLYVAVVGSTWCVWCKKMEQDFHENEAFRSKVAGKFIFVKMDMPISAQPPAEVQRFMHDYGITGAPTVLILNAQGKELGRFRYRVLDPSDYADLVLQTLAP